MQISTHLETNNIININQFGFTRKSSTESAVQHLLDFIYTRIEDGRTVGCIFIDLSKAFDCIDHGLLLKKLEYYGFHESAITLISSYLSNRSQFTQNKMHKSSTAVIRYGVPQGSILGPILFNIFINDIFNLRLFADLHQYADDGVLKYAEQSLSVLRFKMQQDLNVISNWFNANYLYMNASKTQYMLFGPVADGHIDLKIGNTEIKKTLRTKYLGLIIDYDLKWKTHIDSLKSKILPILFLLRRSRSFITEKTAWMIYFTHVHSRIMYMLSIYGAAPNCYLNSLQRIQNQFIKVVRMLPLLTPTRLLYNDSLLNIKQLYFYSVTLFVYKIKNNLMKFNQNIIELQDIHQYHTRGRQNIVIPHTRRLVTSKNVTIIGAKVYNRLPHSIRIVDVEKFKIALKNFVCSNIDMLNELI